MCTYIIFQYYKKRAIRLIFSVHFCEYELPLTFNGFFLLHPGLHKYCLCLFMQRLLKYYPCVLNDNNFVLRSIYKRSATNNKFVILYACNSMRRN